MHRLLFLCLLLSACSTETPNPVIVSKIEYVQQTPFPPKPTLIKYSSAPIQSAIDNTYVVTGEFVENGILLKKYSDKIDTWKDKNNVK
jgi:PBP1b-binding outer membrane lipoprotein LpoB